MTEPGSPVVLVVDDEPDVADSYAAIAGERYDVRTGYSGEQALSKLDDDVDVVLLDRRMPDILGDEVLSTIRDRAIDCRVAMVTAIDPDIEIIDMEFDDYVVKPVTREELLETIERMLRVAEYERTLREYYRVTRKHVTLSSADEDANITGDPEFAELEQRREELRERLEQTADAFADADFETLFREFEGDFDA
ncbi:DNA-binding protein [Halobacteriales archaeon QH_10_67_22]|nr:MAG: DNA-binding protein [Halobacteriales archaeon QH_10_67_22]